MRTTVSLTAFLIALAASSAAHAIPRPCPQGSEWDTSEGSCVKIKKVRKKSPEEMARAGMKLLDEKARGFKPARGLALLEKSCVRGFGKGCYALGWFYRHGRFVEASIARGLELYERACELKVPLGCVGVAAIHSDGLITKKPDHAKAIPFLVKACELGSGRGCFELGTKHAKALGTAVDAAKAAQFYRKAVSLLAVECPGRASACEELGSAYSSGLGVAKDAGKALEYWRKGCDGGAGDACRQVADSYRHGRGVAVDQLTAKKFFDRACNKFDNAQACYSVGFMILGWESSARDVRALSDYAARACELDKRHCALRGNLYTDGIGVPKDQRLAAKYFLLACEDGSAASCYVSGNRAQRGDGVPRSQSSAIRLWTRACEMSWARACRSLGDVYRDGTGVGKNAQTAVLNYQRACLRDDGVGCVSAGDLIATGTIGKLKKTDADLYFRAGCRLKNGLGCRRLAERGGKDKDGVKKGLDFLEKGCNYGDAESCQSAGRKLYFGEGVDQDKGRAARLFALSCKHGNNQNCWWVDQTLGEAADKGKRDQPAVLRALDEACTADSGATACQVLGRAWIYGGNIDTRQVQRGVRLFRQLCDSGKGPVCLELGMLYGAGRGVVKDTKRAEAIYKRECERNTPNACNMLGLEQWNRGEYADALTLFHRGCEENDGPACNIEAFAYYTAKGRRWDTAKGAELYQKSCNLGYPLACANVGELHRIGVVLEKDEEKSFEAYQKACTPTEAAGCTWVGRAYHLGKVVPRDPRRAEREYRRTCNDEDWASAESCLFLAELLEQGSKGSLSTIASLRQQAFQIAEKNIKESGYYHHLVGQLHQTGIATLADQSKALEHWTLGCEAYDPQSCLAAGRLLLSGDSVDGGTIAADRKRALFMAERACAAAIVGGCELAAEAKKPPAVTPTANSPANPGVVEGKKGCGGCGTSGDSGGAWVLLAMIGWMAFRRRKVGANAQLPRHLRKHLHVKRQ